MINTIALHKLSKLRNSKLLLIFFIAAAFICLLFVAPMVVTAALAGGKVSGSEALAIYFYAINFVGHAAALIIGATCWRSDLRDGTILTFAARPLSRLSLFFGKVIGCIYAVLLYFAVALAFFAIIDVLAFSYIPPLPFYLYLLQQILSIVVTFAVVLFLSNFFNPVLAVVLAVVYFLIGGIGSLLASLSFGFWHILGVSIEAISISRSLSYSPIALLSADVGSLTPLWNAIGYYALWIMALVAASALLFERRELLIKRS